MRELLEPWNDKVVYLGFGVIGRHFFHAANDLVAVQDVLCQSSRRQLQRLLICRLTQFFALENFFLNAEESLLGDGQSIVPVDQANGIALEKSEQMRKLLFKFLFDFPVSFGYLRDLFRQHFAKFTAQHAEETCFLNAVG
ncbi:hypothetical protein D3C87_1783090 [compost metagenome]